MGGNPVVYVDPFGLEPNQICVAACTGVGSVVGGTIGYYGGGLLGGILGGAGGTLVGPEGTVIGGGLGAITGSEYGGAVGAAAGSAAGNAAGQAFCPDSDDGPSKADCKKAKKLLKEVIRLAEKNGRRLPESRKEELRNKIRNKTITSNDLPGSIQSEFPPGLRGKTLAEIEAICR